MTTRNIVSLSGGKDSVAMWLWAIREGLDPIAVYIDTGWEWDGHHEHLDALERRVAKIHRIAPAMSFEDQVDKHKTFPSMVRRWCTESLKLAPFRLWLDDYRDKSRCDVRVLLGIRHDESRARQRAVEREWSDYYDCEVWRPILAWSVADVVGEHTKSGVPMHPLYHLGAERVGCWPCVMSGKNEIRLVADVDPARIDRIRAMESHIGATMFTRDRRAEKSRCGDEGPSVVPAPIDEVVAWAHTDRGGHQYLLIRPDMGCARWGICEKPPA